MKRSDALVTWALPHLAEAVKEAEAAAADEKMMANVDRLAVLFGGKTENSNGNGDTSSSER